MRAEAFSPGHVTGFVQFPMQHDDPLLNGSLGAGFSISSGIRTRVSVEEGKRCSVFVNGKHDDAEVSRYVVGEYLALLKKNYSIIVEHESQIPIGYGLGASGAAALSLSYALNEALGRPLTNLQAAQIAHKADFTCRCGVGTVIAEFHGGFEMRLNAGAPGIGLVEKIPVYGRKAVLFCIAPVSTKEFLTNKVQLMNGIGGKMLSRLINNKSIDTFVDLSLEFAKSIGFMSDRCEQIIEDLLANGYRASTAMFGETVFLIVNDDVHSVKKILDRYDGKMLVCSIDNYGARTC
ncbi:MAG: pantoate kinase [Nitrososphaerales archaeon]